MPGQYRLWHSEIITKLVAAGEVYIGDYIKLDAVTQDGT